LVSDNFSSNDGYSPSRLKKLKPKYLDPSKVLASIGAQECIEGALPNNLVSSLAEDQWLNKQAMGFDVLRLSSPPIDTMNEDFLCG
jgi:hypothetical protein